VFVQKRAVPFSMKKRKLLPLGEVKKEEMGSSAKDKKI
jgi:hypothetical protein